MKKQLFIMPLLLIALSACGSNNGGQSENNTDNSQNPSDSTPSNPQTGSHSGLSASDAFTVDELITFMDSLGENTISSQEYYVTGVLGDSSYNSTYKQYTAYFQGHLKADEKPVELYSAVLDSSITGDYTTTNALAGATVVAKGYLELYRKDESSKAVYELPYLPASVSPTSAKYNPTILSVNGGTSGGSGTSEGGNSSGTSSSSGVAGDNASETGTIPSNATTLTFDFKGGSITGISATSSSSPSASGVATVSDYQFNYKNAIAHAASDYVTTGYLGLCAKGASAVASFANKTAIPGKIVKVDVVMPVEKSSGSVSAMAPFVIDFGTSALGSTSNTTGGTGGSGVTLSAYASGVEASYFAISVIQGTSSSGKATWYNGYVASIVVTYVA